MSWLYILFNPQISPPNEATQRAGPRQEEPEVSEPPESTKVVVESPFECRTAVFTVRDGHDGHLGRLVM